MGLVMSKLHKDQTSWRDWMAITSNQLHRNDWQRWKNKLWPVTSNRGLRCREVRWCRALFMDFIYGPLETNAQNIILKNVLKQFYEQQLTIIFSRKSYTFSQLYLSASNLNIQIWFEVSSFKWCQEYLNSLNNKQRIQTHFTGICLMGKRNPVESLELHSISEYSKCQNVAGNQGIWKGA